MCSFPTTPAPGGNVKVPSFVNDNKHHNKGVQFGHRVSAFRCGRWRVRVFGHHASCSHRVLDPAYSSSLIWTERLLERTSHQAPAARHQWCRLQRPTFNTTVVHALATGFPANVKFCELLGASPSTASTYWVSVR